MRLNIARITRKDTNDLVYMYGKSENRQMALHLTLCMGGSGEAQQSRNDDSCSTQHKTGRLPTADRQTGHCFEFFPTKQKP